MNGPPKRMFLLVEDEFLIRMMLADMLEDLGHGVAAEAGTLGEGLSLARDAAFDAAILDINLAGTVSAPIAKVLADRSIPFLLASGYSEAGIPAEFNDRPVLHKPFQQEQLEQAIQLLVATG